MEHEKVFVRGFYGKYCWVIETSQVCKFESIRVFAAFIIATAIYFSEGVSGAIGMVIPGIATALAAFFVNFIGSKTGNQIEEKNVGGAMREVHTTAPLILFLAIIFAGFSFIQRTLTFYDLI